ncbi:unnamed protein product [Urochloa decumbens]|uniref:non-specific serine/threonine protein kinase n=1 Tax=Urochloa decumbens TaxID=240449 RepID=A0ABC9GKZ6_9POAL
MPQPLPAMAAAALPLLLLLLHLAPDRAAAVRFDYATLTLGSLKLLGDAHLKNGTIHLSHDMPVPTSGAGRALYATAVPVRAGFSTQFAFTVATLNPSSVGGGLAFVVSTDGASLGDAGPYIGVDTATDAAAVEFDTLMDVQFGDVNGNHVGLDLGSMVSAAVADLDEVGVELTSGRTVNAWIDYRPKDKGGILEVSVSYAAKRPPAPVLSAPLDLGQTVKDAAFVGFSASTQGSTEVHAIEWWTFSTASPAPAPESPAVQAPPPSVNNPPVLPSPVLPGVTTPAPPAATTVSASAPAGSSISAASAPAAAAAGNAAGSPHPPAHAAVAGAATAGAFVAASFAGFALWALARRARARRRTALSAAASTSRRDRDGSLASAAALARSPREFSYKELSAATRGFDASRVIGNGAFGTVYKGIIPDTGAMVAVKRCTNGNASGNGGGDQARSEFLSELSIIAGLRHRNLLRLQGWCYEKGEILLVYDYMRNGSLDRALFDASSPVLPWHHRRDILAGVASALAYLHHECERRVIHRDVKSSNVMLDESFRARLGDFGLARQAEHGASPDATAAAGTMGYLAPEYLLTGRATESTDVFSFGALALEVACGRRPIGTTEGRCNNLVEWVWSLHGEARVMEAVDPRLGGEFEEGEVRRALLVGLACSSPEPALRPGMRAVVQMLGGEADPPFVPAARPSMSFSANHQLLLSLQDSVSDYNALGLTLSEDSSEDSMSSSSLTSTLRRGGHDIGFSSTAGDAR